MKLDCASVSDAIWASLREGTQLGEEVLQHVESCGACADILAEARDGLAALGCIAPYPTAPDCRSAVWSRVSRRRVWPVRAWAYACTIAAVALIVAGGLMWPRGERQASRQTKNQPEAARLVSPSPVTPESTPKVRVAESTRHPAPRHVKAHKRNAKRNRSMPDRRLPSSVNTAAKPAEGNMEPKTPPAEDSSALAYVTWRIVSQPSDSYQDSYTETDPVTGEVTRCSVKRKGNAVKIEMESEPAQPEESPVKESHSNETILCG